MGLFSHLPRLTRIVLVANVIVFVLQLALPGLLENWFALWPLEVGFQPWQVLTYAFLHGSVLHIALNMYGLVMFGADLERTWGSNRFLRYYVVSLLSAGLTQLAVTAWLGQTLPTVGASGGVFGLLLGYAVMFPQRRIVLLFPPIPMPAWVFALLFAAIELVSGVMGNQTGVAHFAHLGGMLGGFLMLRRWARERR
ncbi:MAG: rhomboid family intramembrane serine protease [Steroidobacteraceae bacterium]